MSEIPAPAGRPRGADVRSLLTVDLASQTVSQFLPSSPLTAHGSAARGRGGGGESDRDAGARAGRGVQRAGSCLHRRLDDRHRAWRRRSDELSNHVVEPAAESHWANRALVVGDLLASGPAIAIGTPGAAVPGSVSLFTATSSAVTCAGVLSAPASSDSGFGQTLAIGDFDGDGVAGFARRRAAFAGLSVQGPGRARGRTDRHNHGAAGERCVRRGAGGGERGWRAG